MKLIDKCRLPGETETEYIYRICSNKDSIGSWIDVADLLNNELGHDYSESKYRKDYSSFQRIYEGNAERFNSGNYAEDIRQAKEELQRERYKIQAEKLDYMRSLRDDAREEMILEGICRAISKVEPLKKPIKMERAETQDRGFTLIFGDEHYGAEFEINGIDGSVINKYNPDIFEDRMWNMLDKVVEIIEKEGITTLNVFCVGDFADGVLRIGQLIKLRYGVVDSTVKYMEFMANWLNELTRFCRVKFYMVDGNHTEIRMFNQPKGTFKDENMGKIVRTYIKARLDGNPNFEMLGVNRNICHANIVGYDVVCVHGEQRDMVRAMKEISNVYHMNIDYLIAGHLHHSEYETVGIDRGVIRCPSIVGTDTFSIGINRASNPAATLCVFEDGHGKTIEYTIDLK